MRRLLLLPVLLLVPGLGSASVIEPFTAVYDVKFSGLSGETVTSLSKTDGDRWVFENRTRALGIARLARPRDAVDRSTFSYSDGQPKPYSFESEDGTRRNKRGSTINFDWDSGNAAASYRDESRTIEIEDGVLDRQLMQVAMMQDLARGVTEASYTVIDRHDKKQYDINVLGRETIEVPAGTFEALRIERRRPGSSRSTVMWCAPELSYLTVRMEQLKEDKTIAILELTEIER